MIQSATAPGALIRGEVSCYLPIASRMLGARPLDSILLRKSSLDMRRSCETYSTDGRCPRFLPLEAFYIRRHWSTAGKQQRQRILESSDRHETPADLLACNMFSVKRHVERRSRQPRRSQTLPTANPAPDVSRRVPTPSEHRTAPAANATHKYMRGGRRSRGLWIPLYVVCCSGTCGRRCIDIMATPSS
ncbi:hypothetical protein PYCCODRAFT_1030081 [Trametes coccinea BRFM310]|uniref:Uncharacterized protein n=1 Tax=Trametes coccinea (strain BRFM310) TaxID=1353009 RepID=A0A1Y2ICD5_TRAC3|nr:hypothetical protein PYCCODRAFT_1030081 [Trametes coccinea BRFM310]